MKLESHVGRSFAGLELLGSSHPASSVSRGSQCLPQTISKLCWSLLWFENASSLIDLHVGPCWGLSLWRMEKVEWWRWALMFYRVTPRPVFCFLFLAVHACHSAVPAAMPSPPQWAASLQVVSPDAKWKPLFPSCTSCQTGKVVKSVRVHFKISYWLFFLIKQKWKLEVYLTSKAYTWLTSPTT